MKKVIVIGGGASGMMAAAIAAREGKQVMLVEKNEKLGKKLFITGKGRCNVTNSIDDINELINSIPGNGNFLYSAFYTFSNCDLMSFLESQGLKLKTERGNRVFPESDKSSDVIKTFERLLLKYNVNIMLNSKVDDIIFENKTVKGILCGGREFKCDSIVIATGGKSYPITGSTGDGYKFAEKAGHTIITPRPSLVPLVAGENWIKELQGLSLKNVSIKVIDKNKTLYEDFGEMIFTHFGVSGPIILSASRFLIDKLPGRVKIHINLKPGLTVEQLDKRIQKDFEKFSRKQFKNSLDDLLPKKIIPVVINLSNISEEKEVNQITREERTTLANIIRQFTITITDTRQMNEAIITSGGVSVKEIDPSTMESKLISGLYFAGEVIDVDGLTGGFNLQIAFSTGYCAGFNC